MSRLLDRVGEIARWAWNPPESRMIDHPFYPVPWMNQCGAIPGHGDDRQHCPTPGHCHHNSCGEPRYRHREVPG